MEDTKIKIQILVRLFIGFLILSFAGNVAAASVVVETPMPSAEARPLDDDAVAAPPEEHETICSLASVWCDGENEPKKPETFKAVRTKYSRADSCHNPRVRNGKTECLTAIGRDTAEGVTVACPRSMKLGTKIRVEGHVYVCEDRYSSSLDGKRGMPTIDVFAEADGMADLPGYKVVDVEIIE